jgi:hypothetical protein
MNCESVIYLDSDFLSKKYEDCYGEPVMTSLIRDEGLKAELDCYSRAAELTPRKSKATTAQSMEC